VVNRSVATARTSAQAKRSSPHFYDVRGVRCVVRGVAVPPDPRVSAVRHTDVVAAAAEEPAGEQGAQSAVRERLEEDIDVEDLGQFLSVGHRCGVEPQRGLIVARSFREDNGAGELIHAGDLPLGRPEHPLPEQVGLATPVHTLLGQLELVDKALGLPVAVRQRQASAHGLMVVAQAERETA
jgi:hypothetical protein